MTVHKALRFSGPADQGKALEEILQNQARTAWVRLAQGAFTDNSTGSSAGGVTIALAVPATAYDGSSTGAAPAAAFNTAMDAFQNACAVVAEHFNDVMEKLGLTTLTDSTAGTVAVEGTIPAQTKALTTTSGATAIDFTTGAARMSTARNNIATLIRAFNQIASAVVHTTLTDSTGGSPSTTLTLSTIADATAGTGTPAGATSISDAAMDVFLTALADNVAVLASKFNALRTTLAAAGGPPLKGVAID
jgi:hypothetical protein